MLIGSEKEKKLKLKMDSLNIRECDIREDFKNASGPGGQNVNKLQTCVTLVHLPTGITVKCQEHRTQYANRFFAREQLILAIETHFEQIRISKRNSIEKLRRQNRKRPVALKEKILQHKKKVSLKKQTRALSKASAWNKEL